MKRLFYLFILAIALSQTNVYGQESLLAQGNTQYKQGKFSEAAKLYEAIVRDPKTASAAAYYNLGNASLKSGAKAHALVYYERALKAAPRDKDLRWNLHVLKGTFADNIEDKSNLIVAFLREFLSYLRMDEVAYTFSAMLALLAMYYIFGFYSSAFMWSWLKNTIFVLIFISGILFGLKYWFVKDARIVVLDKEVYVHYGPSEQESKAFLLHEGADGVVIDESGDWYDILLANKNSGWIRKTSCEVI